MIRATRRRFLGAGVARLQVIVFTGSIQEWRGGDGGGGTP